MFGKLKEAAGGAAVRKAVDAITPTLTEQLEKVRELDPGLVRNDESYDQLFVQPALLAVGAGSGGLTSLVPSFNERFKAAMLRLRDELLVLDGERVELVEGFRERLPQVVLASLQQA
jgi:hypothetical protein